MKDDWTKKLKFHCSADVRYGGNPPNIYGPIFRGQVQINSVPIYTSPNTWDDMERCLEETAEEFATVMKNMIEQFQGTNSDN